MKKSIKPAHNNGPFGAEVFGGDTTITVVWSPKRGRWEIHIDGNESSIVVLCEDQPVMYNEFLNFGDATTYHGVTGHVNKHPL